MNMNMGDPSAIPAEEVVGADLTGGAFVLLDSRPAGYERTSGTAFLARHDGGSTVTIRLADLVGGVDYIAHLHAGTCAESGGDHFKFDPAGSDFPPNEIHLAFTAAADDTGFMTVENDRAAVGARSVVVHPRDALDDKIACAQLN